MKKAIQILSLVSQAFLTLTTFWLGYQISIIVTEVFQEANLPMEYFMVAVFSFSVVALIVIVLGIIKNQVQSLLKKS
jgi:hypothetical protein